MNIYAVIIGTEILNGRRQDRHFEFLKKALAQYGHTLFASFIIKDDTQLIAKTFKFVKADKDSVMFSFGGIGSTPDDMTREVAAKVFTSQTPVRHPQFYQDIVERFGDEAYPHRIHMADLPAGAKLLKNPVNNMSGFSLNERFFFVPGFPEMAHPMVKEVLERSIAAAATTYRKTLIAQTSENTLIETMMTLPEHIELSSLPMLHEGVATVELSLSSPDRNYLEKAFQTFQDLLQKKHIAYTIV